jgi:MurNAc alpha-1-phosphate uridylyltransferase
MLSTALIFSAGRGERLRPYTLQVPKPMLEIKSKPLLAYHLEKLSKAGFQRVIINHAYLGYVIKHYFGNGKKFNLDLEYFAEPPGGLETGGTLSTISKELNIQDDFLFCINADIFTDIEFSNQLQASSNINAHLILIPPTKLFKNPDFGLSSSNYLRLTDKEFIYSGIGYYRVKALKSLPIGRFSIREWLFQETIKKRITGEIYQGKWNDIGTIERLEDARK